MGHVRLKIDNQIVVAQVLDQRTTISRNTKKDLYELEVQFATHESAKDFYSGALQSGRASLLPLSGDGAETIVTISEKLYSYQVGVSMQQRTWLVSEEEQLTLESLQLADMTINPYNYRDHFDQDALICNLCCDLDAASYKAFRSLPLFFPVVRKGVSDEPRTMRFGQVLWASDDKQKYRLRATLVEDSYDKASRGHAIMDPMFSIVMDKLTLTTLRLSNLVNLMKSKGLLTEEEERNVIEISDAELHDQNLLYNRLKDFDGWIENES